MGVVDVNLTVPADASVGFHDLDAEFLGTPGSTGLIGVSYSVTFVVLAQTVINITESSSAITAGDVLYVNGTLLDELGMLVDGNDSIAVVYLLIDKFPVSSNILAMECSCFGIHHRASMLDLITSRLDSMAVEIG